ncbi:MAG: IS630 family transposase [Rhizobiales bacterium]|nr:IS630 family transposase [Hyphomicrobiales bacterium]
MVAPRRVIALPSDEEQRQHLLEISRSRTEPASRVERARIILAYLEEPSAYVVARRIGVTQQTVTRCLKRAAELGVIEALDDRPRAGRDPVITAEAKTWLVALACQKPKELGYPHELWTTRLLAAHARQHAPLAGHPSLGKLAQGTVCKILAEPEVKPHKVRYYLEKRDPEFGPKMAEILCVYRQVAMLRRQAGSDHNQGQDGGGDGSLAIVSYDEKPGIQAIATTAPDRPPLPGTSPTVMRDHEYKRLGTLTLMAGIDLLTGHVHALVKERHRSREFIEFLKTLDAAYPADTAIEVILDNHSADISRETSGWLAAQPIGRFTFTFTPTHGSWLNIIEGFFSKLARSVLRHIRVNSKDELTQRLMAFINDVNHHPVVHTWRYKIDDAA